jgi:putative aldouronate transport system substrate-binding protein
MPLADATGKGGYNVVRPNDLMFCSYITKDCQNPQLAMKFLDFFYLDETVTRARHGEKGVDWEESSGKDIYGNDVTTKIINGDAFFNGTQTWGRNGNSILTPNNYNVIEQAADAHETKVNSLLKGTYSSVLNYPVPAETATGLVYTEEEQEVRTEYTTLLSEFILSQRNLFITGGIDPNSDADWNKYLTDLEDFKLSELISIAQDAYDRANAK